MTTSFQEVGHAVRMLRRSPGFTAVAILSLAIGIGANSALFSFHDALLWRPLPVPDPESIVAVTIDSPDDPSPVGRMSYPNYRDLRESTRSFQGLAAHQWSLVGFALSRTEVRQRRVGLLVSDNLFDVLGVEPALGRRFTPDEGQMRGRDAVLILGYDFWQNTLAGAGSILGKSVVMNGIDFTVVGVMPASVTSVDGQRRLRATGILRATDDGRSNPRRKREPLRGSRGPLGGGEGTPEGAAGGLAFALGVIQFFRMTVRMVVQTDLPVVISPELDGRALLVSLLAAAVSVALFGLAPAWQSIGTDLVLALKSADRGRMTRHRTFGRSALVMAQIALSMVLLVAAGLLVDGFRKSVDLNPGFRTDRLLTMSMNTSLASYTPDQNRVFFRDLVDRARAVSGVVSVALTSAIPLDQDDLPGMELVVPEGYQMPQGRRSISVRAAAVDEHYFSTMKMPIVSGRPFTTQDSDTSWRVAIVNEAFAQSYWPSQEPIGKRIRLDGAEDAWLEVVGVSRTSRYSSITEPPTPFLYKPFAQDVRAEVSLIVEGATEQVAQLAAPLREIVRTLDENQPVFNLRTFATFYAQTAIGSQLLLMRTVGAMGVLGLMLALSGLYALVAYSVARRTREIGLRMAVGADRSQVLRMVLRSAFVLSMGGVITGGLASIAAGRLLSAGMVGLGGLNVATYIVVPILLIVLTLAASYIPARRASTIDPLRALRYE